MPDLITDQTCGFLTSNFKLIDYKILAVLQECVCQHSVPDVDKLRQRLIDRQSRRSLIKLLIGGDSG